MKPETRTALGWIIAFFPAAFLLSCINVIKFMTPATSQLIVDRQITNVPAPTKLLLANSGLAAAIPFVAVLVFALALWGIKLRFKEEADRLSYELVAHTGLWFFGTFYFCGVSMALFLPWVITNRH